MPPEDAGHASGSRSGSVGPLGFRAKGAPCVMIGREAVLLRGRAAEGRSRGLGRRTGMQILRPALVCHPDQEPHDLYSSRTPGGVFPTARTRSTSLPFQRWDGKGLAGMLLGVGDVWQNAR